MAEEYCWAITQAVGWYCWCLSGSVVLEFGFQLDPLVRNNTVDPMYARLRLTLDRLESTYFICYGVSVWWQNS